MENFFTIVMISIVGVLLWMAGSTWIKVNKKIGDDVQDALTDEEKVIADINANKISVNDEIDKKHQEGN